jgi:hypothetical protein
MQTPKELALILRQNWDNANISILKLAEVGGIRPNGKAEETAHRGARNVRRGSIKCLWLVKAKGRKNLDWFLLVSKANPKPGV